MVLGLCESTDAKILAMWAGRCEFEAQNPGQKFKKRSVMAWVCNPSPGEAETSGPWRLMGQPARSTQQTRSQWDALSQTPRCMALRNEMFSCLRMCEYLHIHHLCIRVKTHIHTQLSCNLPVLRRYQREVCLWVRNVFGGARCGSSILLISCLSNRVPVCDFQNSKELY